MGVTTVNGDNWVTSSKKHALRIPNSLMIVLLVPKKQKKQVDIVHGRHMMSKSSHLKKKIPQFGHLNMRAKRVRGYTRG